MAAHDGDLVLLHQEVEALGVLHDDVVLALEDVGPVQLGRGLLDAVACRRASGGPRLRRREHGLGGDAAPVEAGTAELVSLFNERDLEAELCGGDGAGVAGGAAADDYEVVKGFCHGEDLRFIGAWGFGSTV